jgi:ubiquinone/menaquinone biosynthesis C-methylase UbiE
MACGGGSYSVPVLLNGTRVIAADISGVMLGLLREKAIYNNADMTKLTICRMNAYKIPLSDNSVDCAMANSVLHLLSNPQKAIDELYRVIKPGGCLILGVNSPAIDNKNNSKIDEINKPFCYAENNFHHCYWQKAHDMGYHRTEHSWHFDQYAACKELFTRTYEIKIDFYEKRTEILEDYFLYRMGGKGFSDQQGVPDEIHNKIFNETIEDMKKSKSNDFEKLEATFITNGITLQVFKK